MFSQHTIHTAERYRSQILGVKMVTYVVLPPLTLYLVLNDPSLTHLGNLHFSLLALAEVTNMYQSVSGPI